MNYYMIIFQDGQKKEFKALNDDQAIKRTDSILRRFNQPEGHTYRTNPYNARQKRKIGSRQNPEYNPEKESITKDPAHLLIKREPEKPKKKRRVSATVSGAPRTNFTVPLKEVAEKMGVEPATLRRKLRRSEIQKPEGGWGWDSWEHPDVREILSWK